MNTEINYTKIMMPALSPTMEKGRIYKWSKKIGDKIQAGDALLEVETDKATLEYQPTEEGYLAKILYDEQQEVSVGEIIAILVDKSEDIDKIKDINFNDKNNVEVKSDIEASKKDISIVNNSILLDSDKLVKNSVVQPKGNSQDTGRIKASPIARRLANENNIHLDKLSGSGPNGRIIKTDILEEIEKSHLINSKSNEKTFSVSKPDFSKREIGVSAEVIEITPMRRVIAERLTQSKNSVPHFYLSIDLLMDEMLLMRQKINQNLEKLQQSTKITVNDLFIKIVAKALEMCPEMNRSWQQTHINQNLSIDVSVAVAIENGLITPIVFDANKLALSQISSNVKDLVKRAKENKLKPSEFQGGSVTISNLGMFDIDQFSAIINPPQSAILAIGGVKKQAVVINDEIVIRQVTKITLSVDHRVIDGAVAAKYINIIKQLVENPDLILI